MRSTIIIIMAALALLPGAAQVMAQTAAPSTAAQTGPGNEPNPTPEHTGWATLIKDTGKDFVAFPRRKSTWTLLAIGGAAALATHPADDYVRDHVVGNNTAEHVFKAGKWIGNTEVEIGTSVALWLIGRYIVPSAAGEPRTNKLSHLGFDLLRTEIVTEALVEGIKYSVRRDRPSGECCAFPSGHSATAFAIASVLERHLGYRASWPMLAGATYVATSRLVDNRHFLSDVMFGAGLGIAAGWTVVGRHGRDSYVLQPIPVRGGAMVALVRVNPDHGDAEQ